MVRPVREPERCAPHPRTLRYRRAVSKRLVASGKDEQTGNGCPVVRTLHVGAVSPVHRVESEEVLSRPALILGHDLPII